MMIEKILYANPFIIAEIGSNYSKITDCVESIRLAKIAGADAAKFQLYTHEALYGRSGEIAGVLQPSWLPKLKEACDRFQIEFMCSTFSQASFEVINPMVNVHKIASSEACHPTLLQLAKDSGKPTVISFGAHTEEDIGRVLRFMGDATVIPLYCVAEYPARTVDFHTFLHLRDKFRDRHWGYSDHTLDAIETPRRAAQLGAKVIEKHVNFVGVQGPDSPHSLNFEEFRTMVKAVRGLEYMPLVSDGERSMILRHKRRVIATRDIVGGEELDPTNCGIYRSLKDDAHGAHPFQFRDILGTRLKHYISRGSGISISDVEEA